MGHALHNKILTQYMYIFTYSTVQYSTNVCFYSDRLPSNIRNLHVFFLFPE